MHPLSQGASHGSVLVTVFLIASERGWPNATSLKKSWGCFKFIDHLKVKIGCAYAWSLSTSIWLTKKWNWVRYFIYREHIRNFHNGTRMLVCFSVWSHKSVRKLRKIWNCSSSKLYKYRSDCFDAQSLAPWRCVAWRSRYWIEDT